MIRGGGRGGEEGRTKLGRAKLRASSPLTNPKANKWDWKFGPYLCRPVAMHMKDKKGKWSIPHKTFKAK